MSTRTGDFSWSEPLNLGSDINTQYRETTPYLTIDKSTLYFSSNRPGGMGGNDIYFSKRINSISLLASYTLHLSETGAATYLDLGW